VDTRHSSLKWEWPEEYWRWEWPRRNTGNGRSLGATGGILEVGVARRNTGGGSGLGGILEVVTHFVSLDLPLHLLVVLHSLLQLVTGEEFWVVALVNVPGESSSRYSVLPSGVIQLPYVNLANPNQSPYCEIQERFWSMNK